MTSRKKELSLGPSPLSLLWVYLGRSGGEGMEGGSWKGVVWSWQVELQNHPCPQLYLLAISNQILRCDSRELERVMKLLYAGAQRCGGGTSGWGEGGLGLTVPSTFAWGVS